MLFSIRRPLGRPFGFPDVPLTNRVAMPASCSLSYRPAADFDSEGRSIRDSSNESAMEAPKVGSGWSYEISTFPSSISHLIRALNYVRKAQDLKVAGPHMPKAFSACADHSRKGPLGSNVSEPSLGNYIKSVTPQSEERSLACVLLPAPNRHIDVLRVKLDRPRASTCLFRSNQDCSAATKGIENDTPTLRAILNGVCDHRDRLHRRMHGQLVQTPSSHRVHAIVVPHVCAVAAKLTEFESVQMRSRAVLPHKNELVLGAVECAHSRVRLIPNADVLKLQVVGI